MKAFEVKVLVAFTIVGDIFFYCMSYFLSFYIIDRLVTIESYGFRYMLFMLVIPVVVTGILMRAFDLIKNIFYRDISNIISSLVIVFVLSAIISNILSIIFIGHAFPMKVILLSLMIQIIVISVWRVIIWHTRKSAKRKQRIMVIGSLEEAKNATIKCLLKQGHIFDVKYIYDIENGIQGAIKLISNVDHILIGSNVDKDDCELITIKCMKLHKNIFLIPDIFFINLNNAQFIQIGDIPMFNLSRFGLSIEQMFVKRCFDVIVSGITLILLSPVFLFITIAIKVTDPGPAIFKQERITMDNKKYHILKFRTMVVGAEDKTGPMLATDCDPRITRIGNFLRATRLDELPQMINVFQGTMSIIGPRPERKFFIDQYVEETPIFEYRTLVKAGVTGLAQVLGKYTTSFEDKLRYDLVYIKNYSYALDLKIIFMTIKVIFTRDASQGVVESMTFESFIESQGYKLIRNGEAYEMVAIGTEELVEDQAEA